MGSVVSSFSSSSPLPLPPPSSSPTPSPPSSPCPAIKHDVFVSFRGGDIRDNFLSHLREAFDRKGIDAFIDDQLERGQEISPALLQAIEESQISVVIFSENYADSTWCLEELVKILECSKNHGQTVIPVFYKTEPSEVRQQTGSYADAFEKHKDRFKEDLDKVQKWRDDLREAANISGLVASVVKPESAIVEKIVGDVWEKLINTPSSENNTPSSDNMQQVGIESKITKLEEMLRMGDNNVRKVGICGIGGIGKTTLAKAIFDKIYCQFPEGHFFIGSVREASEKKELNLLKQELYPEKLKGRNTYGYYPYTKKRFRPRKLFIVFDDVTTFQQIEALIGDLDHCFGLGSRFIITSRSQQVLKNCGVNDIYMVEELCFNDSLKLFCWHAFKQNHPKIDYRQLSKGVVIKVGGVPLALKVLGSSLLGKTKEVWESAMEKLEKNFDRNIHEVLKISYEELDDDQQHIFLDIALFFKGWDVDRVKTFMKACGFFPHSGIDALIDKSLITISNSQLTMHDLLQAMGKEIVRQESINDPGKRSRLWHHKDIYDVLTNETGTITLEGISLDMSKSKAIYLHPRAFANMQKLRFLHFYASKHSGNRVHIFQGLESIFTNLRYLNWDGCPLKSLQSNVLSKNLVELRMIRSKVEELWCGSPQLDNLKNIDLEGSEHLTRLPDLSTATNLERLHLSGCTSLTEIPSSIQRLPKLQYIYFSNNSKSNSCLESIPDCSGLKSLRSIIVHGFDKLKVAPKLPNNVELLYLAGLPSLCEIPSSYKYVNKLRIFSFGGCKSLTGIPDYSGFKSLRRLVITRCSKVKMLPEFPNNIEDLQLVDIPIEELPSSSENLCRLRYLVLSDCSRLKSLPSSVCKWKTLETLYLNNCLKIDKLPDSLGCLTSLETLSLHKINLESMPESIINLSMLQWLRISHCERLKVLPKLPWASIDAVNCTSLEQISCPSFHNDVFALDDGENMIANFFNCFKLDRNSVDNFAQDSLFEIQGQAASIQKITYQQVDQGFLPSIIIRYPGTEIPVWFEYQNKGSFIDVNLPPNWFNYNFLCFALCIVVATQDRQSIHYGENLDTFFYVKRVCSTKSKDGNRRAMINNEIDRWKQQDFPMFALGSNHVEIEFGFHFFNELYGNQLSFQFYLEPISYGWYDEVLNIDNYKVEKCGVHLIYGQHLEILDEKEEDKPHPKRGRRI